MRRVSAIVVVIGIGAGVMRAGDAQPEGDAKAEADAKPGAVERLFFWKVTVASNTVYLLGSIHVGSEAFYPLADEIENAFADSKVLVVEVNTNKVDSSDLEAQLADKGMYEERDSLAKHVSGPTLQKVRAYFAAKGLPAEQMERFRPWALSMTITQLEMQSLGFKSELGVDKHFVDKPGGRPVLELESAEAQMELLGGLDEKQEAALLVSTLDSASKTKALMRKTVAFWKTGDAAGMEKLLVTDPLRKQPDLRPVFAKLFDERNAKMAGKIDGYLKKPKMPYFVVVGAGHLIGNKGIVRLLERKGYKVEQVSRAPKVAGNAEEKKADPEEA